MLHDKLPQDLQIINIYYLIGSEGQESGSNLAERLWLTFSAEVAGKMSAGAPADSQSSQLGLWAQLPAWLTHTAVGGGLSSCWLWAISLSLFPHGPVHKVDHVASFSLRQAIHEKDQGGGCNAFYDLVSEVTRHHFQHILLVRSSSLSTAHTPAQYVLHIEGKSVEGIWAYF